MARDDDFDFDQFDNWESDISNINVPGKTYNTKSDRSPAASAGRFISASLSSGLGSTKNVVGREVDRNFGRTKSVVGEAFSVKSDLERLKTEMIKDAGPLAAQTKAVGRRLLNQAKPYMPNSLASKLEKKLKESETFGSVDTAKAENLAIDTAIERVFMEQQTIEEERRQEDAKKEQVEQQIDRTLDSSRHKDVISILDEIRRPVQGTHGFFKTVYPAYLKESLKLQFKSFFVIQKQLETTQIMTKILENKLEEIRQNTALPDIQKQTKMESLKDDFRSRISQRVNSKLAGWGSRIVGNVKDRIYDPTRQMMDLYGMGLDGIQAHLDERDMMREFEDFSGKKGPDLATMLGKGVGSVAGRMVGGKAMRQLMSKYNPYTRSMEDLAKTAKMRAMIKARDKFEEGHGGMSGFALDLLNPGLRSHAGRLENAYYKDPTALTSFDVATKTTLNEIIPGWLSKIEQNTRSIAQGGPVAELAFDARTRDFTTVAQLRESTFKTMFGSQEERTRHLAEGVSTLRAAAAHHGDNLTDFNKLNAEITKFIANHSTRVQAPKPRAIKEVADTGIIDGKYKTLVFEGIKDPQEVAKVICRSLFIDGETIDRQALSKFEDFIFYSASKDEYLDKFPAIADAFGQSRHFKDMFRSDVGMDGRRTFDAKAIGALRFGNVDSKTLSESVDFQSAYLKSDMDSFVKQKGITDKDAPAWVAKALTAIVGDSLDPSRLGKASTGGFIPMGTMPGLKYNAAMQGGKGSPSSKGFGPFVNIADQPIGVIIEGYGKSIDDFTRPSSGSGGSGAAQAIVHFENTFKEYMNRREDSFKFFSSTLEDISTNIINLNMIQSVPEEARQKVSSLKSGGKSIIGRAFSSGKEMAKWYTSKILDVTKLGTNAALGLGRLGMDSISKIGLPALGMGGRGFLNMFDRSAKLSGSMFRGMGAMIKGTAGLFSGGGKLDIETFFDIYRKDQMDVKNPLLSKRKQERGVTYMDGEPVKSSHEIDRVVIDPKSGDILISEEDIKAGLVTKFGVELRHARKAAQDLTRAGSGMLSSGLKKIFGGLTSGAGGIAGMYQSMFGLGIEGMRGAGKLGAGLISKMFGLDPKENKKTVKATLKQAETIEKIYELLLNTIGKKYSDDADGDGLRDGSWQEQDKRKKEARDAKASKSLLDAVKGGSGKGMLGALGGALFGLFKGKQKPGEEGEEDSEGGFGLKQMLQYYVMDKFIGKIPGVKKIGGKLKGLGGKVFGGLKRGLGFGAKAGAGLLGGGALASTVTTSGAGALGATTTATNAAGIAAGTKATGKSSRLAKIVKKLLSKLPSKFAKVVKPAIVLKALMAAPAKATAKILARYSNPIGWVVVGGTMSYAAITGYRSAADILGLDEDLISMSDKLLVGAAAAIADGLMLDMLGIMSVKDMAELLGAGKSAKAKMEKEEKDSEDINAPLPKENNLKAKTEEDAARELKELEMQKAAGEAKGNLIQRTMDKVLNSSVVMAPLKWLTYPVLHPETSARWIYNWFGTEDWNKACQEVRAKAYGIDLKYKYGTWTSAKKVMLKLEELTADVLQEDRFFTEKEIAKMAKWFKLGESTEQIRYWTTWFYQRFMPAFKIFLDILKGYNCTYDNHEYKFPKDKAEEMIKRFEDAVKGKTSELRTLVPTLKGYTDFNKTLKEVEKEISTDQGVGLTKDSVYASLEAKEKAKDTLDKSNKYHTDAKTFEALRRQNNVTTNVATPSIVDRSGSSTSSVQHTLGREVRTSDASTTAGATVKGGVTTQTVGAGKGGKLDDVPQANGVGWDAVKDTIIAAANITGVDAGLLATMAAVESSFDPNAKNPYSSATGLFQFTSDTWLWMLGKYGKKFGIPLGTPPTDARANSLLGAQYIIDNKKDLEKALGRTVTDTDLYTAHFLGPSGAKRLLRGNPNDIAAQLNPAAAKSNPQIFYDGSRPRTLQEVYQVLDDKVKGKRGIASKARSISGQMKAGASASGTPDTAVNTSKSSSLDSGAVSTQSMASTTNMVPAIPGLEAPLAGGSSTDKVVSPVQSDLVTSPFGPRNMSGNKGGGSKDHKGVDLRARTGEPIMAIQDGTVVSAGGNYGTTLIDHGQGMSSKYMHQSMIGVSPGDQVTAGQQIGGSGGRGPSGPNQYNAHLHLEVLKNGKQLDPEQYLRSKGVELSRKGDPANAKKEPLSDVGVEPTGSPKSSSGIYTAGTATGTGLDDTQMVTPFADQPQVRSDLLNTRGLPERIETSSNKFTESQPEWITNILDKMDKLLASIELGFNEGKALVDIKEAVLNIEPPTTEPYTYNGPMAQRGAGDQTQMVNDRMGLQHRANAHPGVVASMARTTTTI